MDLTYTASISTIKPNTYIKGHFDRMLSSEHTRTQLINYVRRPLERSKDEQ